MNTDYMIGDSYGENLISDITLAMFEDSGWYQVDYTNANLFVWGRDKGCDFFNSNCIEGAQTRFKNEFCVNFNQHVCSTSHIFRANCTTISHNRELPYMNRYFENPRLGGVDPLTDYCPIPIETKHNQVYYGGSCRVGNNLGLNKLEKICPECACFMSSLKEQAVENGNNTAILSAMRMSRFLEGKFNLKTEVEQLAVSSLKAACYEFKCEGDSLFVEIQGKIINCNPNGDTIVPGYDGVIQCPPAELLCHQRFKCKFGCTERYNNSIQFFKYK